MNTRYIEVGNSRQAEIGCYCFSDHSANHYQQSSEDLRMENTNPSAAVAQSSQGDDLGGLSSAFTDAASQQTENTGLGVSGATVQQQSTPISSAPVTQTQVPSLNSGASSPSPQAIVPPIASQTPVVNEALQQARSLGLQLPDGANDAQIAQALVQHLRTVQPFVQYGQAYLPHAERIQEALAPAAPVAPVATEPQWNEQEFFQKTWGAPEWRPEFDTAIQRGLVVRDDETGAYVAKPGCEMLVGSILGPLNDATGFNQQKWQEIAKSNPIEFFYKNMLEPMRKQWQQDMQQTLQQERSTVQVQSSVAKFEQDNAAWMYANGQPTQEGQWFLNTVAKYQDKFGGDIMAAIEVANEIRSARTQGQPQASQQQPQQVPQAPQPQAVVAPQAQQPQTSFTQDAFQRASHTPRAGGTTVQSPSYQPENISEMDLNNLFSQTFAASQGVAN
jgi:hypothetical protein